MATKTDSAIAEAQELWRAKQPREAMLVLVRRIDEINEQCLSSRPGRSTVLRYVAVAVAASLITAAVALGLAWNAGVFDGRDPKVQEWWSRSAGPAASEFMVYIQRAAVFAVIDRGDPSSIYSEYEDNFRDYADQFEAAEYPIEARDIREDIYWGMLNYKVFIWYVEEHASALVNAGGLDAEALSYFEAGQTRMRSAARQVEELTGQDASFLVWDGAEIDRGFESTSAARQ